MDTDVEGDPLVGAVLDGRYRIERQLGQGGMGTVYAGTQQALGRRVAIKVLHRHLAEDASLVERFKREAEVAASLGHPNIVQVTDFGRASDGRAFLVMDFLDGQAAADLIAREAPLPMGRVAFIADQVVSALGAAHAAGIVHRDLKPDNVYLTSMSGIDDMVKLLDFGIARLAETNEGQGLTVTGQVLGTPAYMSPEQARGKRVDGRTDLYAAAVLMYEALTGRLPFSGENYHALMFAIVGEEAVPLSTLRPDLDPAFVAIVERGMAKDIDARFQTALELRAALAPFVEATLHSGVGTPAPMGVATADLGVAATMMSPAAGVSPAGGLSPASGASLEAESAPAAASAVTPVAVASQPPPPGQVLAGEKRGAARLLWPLMAMVFAGAMGAVGYLAASNPTAAPTMAAAEPHVAVLGPTETAVAPDISPEAEPAGVEPAGVEPAEAEPAEVDAPADAEAAPAEEAAEDPAEVARRRERRAARRAKKAADRFDVLPDGRRRSVSYSGGNFGHVVDLRAARPILRRETLAFTACWRGHEWVNRNWVLTVTAQGRVTRVQPRGTQGTLDPGVEACMSRALMRLELPMNESNTDGGEITVWTSQRYPRLQN